MAAKTSSVLTVTVWRRCGYAKEGCFGKRCIYMYVRGGGGVQFDCVWIDVNKVFKLFFFFDALNISMCFFFCSAGQRSALPLVYINQSR